jgi:hypothetical protein
MTHIKKFPNKTTLAICLAFIAVPVGFVGCGGGGGGADGSNTNPNTGSAAQVSETSAKDGLTWIETTIPGCKQTTATAQAVANQSTQDAVKQASVLKQVVSMLSEAKGISGTTRMPYGTSQQFAGDCGGTLNLANEHSNGITTYTIAFDNYCSVDDSTNPPQQSKVSGTLTAQQIGTPSNSGPIVSSFTASTNLLTITSKGETTRLTLNNLAITYGTPGVGSPGAPTQAKPDQLTINQASVNYVSQNRTHTLTNMNASSYDSGDNSVMNITSGRYATTSHGYVDLTTSQPLVISSDGQFISGTMNLTGADGNVVQVTPTSTAGKYDVKLNGTPLGKGLDCSGAQGLLGGGSSTIQ